MSYAVLCPDGLDRLHAQWMTVQQVIVDASYFSQQASCDGWSEVGGCPGGRHTWIDVHAPRREREPELAWAVDVPPA